MENGRAELRGGQFLQGRAGESSLAGKIALVVPEAGNKFFSVPLFSHSCLAGSAGNSMI
jgi:hypothetical protein